MKPGFLQRCPPGGDPVVSTAPDSPSGELHQCSGRAWVQRGFVCGLNGWVLRAAGAAVHGTVSTCLPLRLCMHGS